MHASCSGSTNWFSVSFIHVTLSYHVGQTCRDLHKLAQTCLNLHKLAQIRFQNPRSCIHEYIRPPPIHERPSDVAESKQIWIWRHLLQFFFNFLGKLFSAQLVPSSGQFLKCYAKNIFRPILAPFLYSFA